MAANDASALYEAAMTGNTSTLQKLIQRDTLILRRSTVLTSFSETPLHISVLAGHVDFTREILHQDPEMVAEVDSSNSTPLHLAAAARGDAAEIVRILLSVGKAKDACFVRDGDGRIPLHLAVIRGRVGIVRELVVARPDSVLEKLDGDTVLHLCVKNNNLEALKLLVEMIDLSSIMWLGDQDGNTVLHLAVMFKQVQTTSYLASLPNMGKPAANCLNGHGSTPLDCLDLSPKDYKSLRIQNILVQASGGGGGVGAQDDDVHQLKPSSNLVPFPSKEEAEIRKKTEKCFTPMARKFKSILAYDKNWLKDMEETVLLLATIIAAMSFQASTNPPGGVWSENRTSSTFGAGCNPNNTCRAGTSVLAYGTGNVPTQLDFFVAFNTVAFGASLVIMFLIVGGFPIHKNKFVMWLLTQAVCWALTCMTVAFWLAGRMVIPRERLNIAVSVWGYLIGVWIVLILATSLLDTARFLIWLFGTPSKENLGRELELV